MSYRLLPNIVASTSLGLALGGAGLGCEDPLTDPAIVVGPRVLGARVQALGDARVAEADAGERVRVDWLAVSNRPEPLSATLAGCVAVPALLGAPRCAGAALDELRVSGQFGDPVTFELSIPGQLLPGDAWLAWFGHCDAGEADFDAAESVFRCPDGAEPLSAFYRGFVPDAAPNRNPSLSDDVLLLNGAPWLGEQNPPPPGSSCLGTSMPRVEAGAPSLIELRLRGDDREPLGEARRGYASRAWEALVYTHVSSSTGLERAFSAIDVEGSDPAEQGFTLGAELGLELTPGPEGESLVFYLVARDERGGVDWLRRDACLLSR